MKTSQALQVFSCLLFLIPAFYAFSKGVYIFGVTALLTAIISTYYHSIKDDGPHWWWDKTKTRMQTIYLFLDTFVALLLTIFSVYLFYLQDFPPLFTIACIIFIPLFIQFMIPTKKYYPYQHTLWHAGTAILSVLPLIGV